MLLLLGSLPLLLMPGAARAGSSGLVLYLPLNEGSGSIAYDMSGEGNNGTITGASWAAGKYGSALSFDGIDDHVEIPSSIDFDFYPSRDDGVSFSFCINTTDSNTRDILSRNCHSGLAFWLIRNIDGIIRIQIYDGTSQIESDTTAPDINDGVWHHIAISVNFTTHYASMYVDGVEGSQAWWSSPIADMFDSAYSMELAKGTFSGGFLDADIDEVRIFNRPLTSAEILNLYEFNELPPVEYAQRGEILAAALVGALILVPMLIISVAAIRRRR